MQGWRVKMEDAHVARICVNEDEEGREGGREDEGGREGRLALFGVFDGHGGSEVANYCAKHIERVLKESKGWRGGGREGGREGGRDVEGELIAAF